MPGCRIVKLRFCDKTVAKDRLSFRVKYPTVTYTDYMSTLKIGNEWKIVNKVFYAEPKAKS